MERIIKLAYNLHNEVNKMAGETQITAKNGFRIHSPCSISAFFMNDAPNKHTIEFPFS